MVDSRHDLNEMPSEALSAATIKGYAFGVLIMTFFGSFWALMTTIALSAGQRIWLITAVVVVTIPLAYYAITLLRTARQLPKNSSPEGRARGLAMRRGFAIVGGIEVFTIVVANIWLDRAGHDELIPLAIALLVGIHFLPLASIFEVRAYFWTGIAMTLLAAIALIAIFVGWTLGDPYAWSVIVGLGNAIILWLTALYVLYAARQAIKAFPMPPELNG
jgi:hypothetical protein